MQKLLHSKALIRFTAFLLAFCCIFSMAPTMAFAADGDVSDSGGETSTEDDYREIWVISKPGTPIRIIRGADGGTGMQKPNDFADKQSLSKAALMKIKRPEASITSGLFFMLF